MQKGFIPILIIVGLLALSGMVGGGYFYYQQQKIKSINSFEECARAGYPVMQIYPARCNTPDGRSFTKELSEDEKEKLKLPKSDETVNWKTYTFNDTGTDLPKFGIKYPPGWDYREIRAGNPLNLYFYTSPIGRLPRQVNDTTPGDDPSLPQPPKAPIELNVLAGYEDRCPCEDVIISGLPAKKIILEHWEIIELIRGEFTISIMRSLKESQYIDNSLTTKQEIDLFNKMVSTFKFLE